MSWIEQTPDAIVDEFERAVADFLVVWASVAARQEPGLTTPLERTGQALRDRVVALVGDTTHAESACPGAQ